MVLQVGNLDNILWWNRVRTMGHEICKFKTGSKKVLLADSARAYSLTFDTGDLWMLLPHSIPVRYGHPDMQILEP